MTLREAVLTVYYRLNKRQIERHAAGLIRYQGTKYNNTSTELLTMCCRAKINEPEKWRELLMLVLDKDNGSKSNNRTAH